MIVFDLKCAKGHGFEAWFASSAAYEAQVKAREVACPVCGSAKVSKALMAPHVASGKRAEPPTREMATKGAFQPSPEVTGLLRELREQVEKNCEYVGGRFPEEARKIHYGEVDARNIYGETTPEEARSLRDEGVEFGILPWPKRHDS